MTINVLIVEDHDMVGSTIRNQCEALEVKAQWVTNLQDARRAVQPPKQVTHIILDNQFYKTPNDTAPEDNLGVELARRVHELYGADRPKILGNSSDNKPLEGLVDICFKKRIPMTELQKFLGLPAKATSS